MHYNRSTRVFLAMLGIVLPVGVALADDWVMRLTVDNQYDIYFGTNLSTTFYAGGDNNWFTVETWNAFGMLPTDYLYVATASDHSVAQGFIGTFTNTTTNITVNTGDPAFEVFPAGAYLQQIDPTWPPFWPPSAQPTQAQVDAAIAFATLNNLWIPTSQLAGWTNASHLGPWWQNIPGIPASAMWIWHDSGQYPGGFYPAPYGGFNHNEFLVFRVLGIPEPASAALLLAGGLLVLRRRV